MVENARFYRVAKEDIGDTVNKRGAGRQRYLHIHSPAGILAYVSDNCNFVTETCNRHWIDTFLHIVLKFQLDRFRFQRGEASTRVSNANTIKK